LWHIQVMRIALGVALAVVALAQPAESAMTRSASLRVVDMSPFTVHGWRFQPGERVVVSVSGTAAKRSATVTATSAGTFTRRFPALRLGECDIYRVRAVGSKGSKAFLTPPPPSCGTELSP
jgi:hypothetical protein